MNKFLSDLKDEMVFGSIAGFTICLVGHPFDTLKTRMQIQNVSLRKIYT